MRWAEGGVLAAVLLAGFAHADAPGYGKVETFQPGKKYNCVPTADHKGWDCSESGKNAVPKTQPAEATPAPTPAASAPETATKSSDLPSYLTNAAASRPPRARQPAPTPAPSVAEPATPPQESARATQASAPPATATESKPPTVAPLPPAAAAESKSPAVETPSTMSAPPVAAEPKAPSAPEPGPKQTAVTPTSAPQPTAASPPVAEPPPAAAAIAPATADARTVAGNREFLALPSASYILEIAHSANRDELAALRTNLRLPFGELYELHLARDGNDWWLLVWGHFADIESARAARSDLPALPSVNAGWPRRSAPLQAEVRRTTE